MLKLKIMQIAVVRLLLLMQAIAVIGCSSPMTITVKDKGSGKQLEGITVEQNRPVSSAEKILNPVGSTYHPLKLINSKTTDEYGSVSFENATRQDVFRIYIDDARPLSLTVSGIQIELSPTNSPTANTKWGYAVWNENGSLRFSSWPLKR